MSFSVVKKHFLKANRGGRFAPTPGQNAQGMGVLPQVRKFSKQQLYQHPSTTLSQVVTIFFS